MSEMVKRVAAIIYEHSHRAGSPMTEEETEAAAHDAISAMREPSSEMLIGLGRKALRCTRDLTVKEGWDAMFEAALEAGRSALRAGMEG